MDDRRRRLGRLASAHRERAYRAAFRVLARADEALDVVQESFLALRDHLDRVPDECAGAWLARVAWRKALDRVRRPDPLRRASDAAVVPAAVPDPGDEELRARVRTALGELPERQADVIGLRIYENETFVEIARVLGITEGAAKTHFRRGVTALRHRLAPLRVDLDPERNG